MSKVLVVVDNDLDGDGRVLKEINMLIQLNFDVHVLCFGFNGKNYKPHSFDVTRISVSKKKKDRLNFLNLMFPFYRNLWIRAVSSVLLKDNFDVVHTHDLYMAKPVKLGVEKSKLSIPVILDLHENYPVAYKSYSWTNKGFRKWIAKPDKWQELEEEYLKCADGYIFLSEDFKVALSNKYSFIKERSLFILPNVPDLSFFKPIEPMERSEKLTFFYFGVIGKRRGIFEVMDVLAELNEHRNDFKLLLVGPIDKADRKDFEETKSRLCEEVFEYIPWVPLEDLNTYMNIADVGLCPIYKNPQHESGVANKVFQYMYGGLVLLVSDCLPQQRIVEDYNLGFVFTDNNRESLKTNIIKCIEQRDLLNEIGERSNKVFKENFLLENYLEGINSFYKEVIGETA